MLRIKLGLLLLAAAVMGTLVVTHTPGINGPFYWTWRYRSLPLAPVYLAMIASAIPLLAAQLLDRNRRSLRVLAIVMLMTTCLGMKLASAGARANPLGLRIISATVEDPHVTGYYTDAVKLHDTFLPIRYWLEDYPRRMSGFEVHPRTKPPGPIVYWYAMIQLMGVGHSATFVGGVLLGVIAAFAVPATYWLLRLMLQDEPAAFCGASFMALCPGFILFFPMFDPAYILLSTGMLGFWFLALRGNRAKYGCLLGAMLAAALLIATNVLVLGLFMIAMIFIVTSDRPMNQRLLIALKQAAIVLATVAILFGFLWLLTGYDPIATFRSAWENQQKLLAEHADERPYPATILFDLTDFTMGSGWISVLLVLFYFLRLRGEQKHLWLVLAAMAQLMIVAITGLLQSETSRVWNFMLPLWMLPVGLELSRWPVCARMGCLAALAFVTIAIHQNMRFIY